MPPDITARLSEALATAARPARRPAHPARSRWAGPATIAAAVTILAGLGITAFSHGDLGWPATAPESETRASTPAVVAPPTERVFASGTNYARADLGSALALVAGTHPSPLGGPSLLSGASGAPDASTLRDRRWLIPCLDAVAAEHGKGPLSFDLVDFAAFEGSPAVVIRVIDQQDAKWVWVVGPECGSGGAHTRYRARVG
jgi:hypothetical protein